MMKLRDFGSQDARSIVQHANNLNVSKYLTSLFPYPYTLKDAEWWVAVGVHSGLNKAIVLDGECVGGIGMTFGQAEHLYSAYVGYWLGESHWGKGIAAKALKQMTDRIFSEGIVVRMSASVYSPNKASMRVLEKCGYQLEGTLVQAVFKNNEFMDEHIYTKLSRSHRR